MTDGSSANLSARIGVRDLMEKNQSRAVWSACGRGARRRERFCCVTCTIPTGWPLRPTARRSGLPKLESLDLSRAAIAGRGDRGPYDGQSATCRDIRRGSDNAGGGGFWLSFFAVRTHLVEFVLREDDFRQEMMKTIPNPAYWISPALASGE